jgi:hypothetical protein|tara:strand:+ start:661 stop:1407 length:747 start_codon:yes stop_codon:yes gene_type:complete
MTYFVRRYVKGVKNSGTQDLISSEDEINLTDFVKLAHETGPGKYVLGQRGRGIRGFKKITDCLVEQPTQVFAAETISVRKTMNLAEMNDKELMELLGSMTRTPISSPEEMTTYQQDLEALHRELSRRNMGTASMVKSSESSSPSPAIASAGFAVGNKSAAAMGLVAGLVIGALGTSMYYKGKIDDLQATIDRFDTKLQEAESFMKKAEARETKRAAAEAAKERFDAVQSGGLGGLFLSDYNQRNGPQY